MRESLRRQIAVVSTVVLAGLTSAVGQVPQATNQSRLLTEYSGEREIHHARGKALVDAYVRQHKIAIDKQDQHAVFYTPEGKFRFVDVLNSIEAAATVSALHVWETGEEGFSLDGSTQRVGVWDAGNARETHVEFISSEGSRVEIGEGTPIYHAHATGIAGAVGAAGVLADAHGLAPKVQIVSYNWGNDLAEMALEAEGGMTLSNHAYGTVCGWGPALTIDGETLPTWYGDTSISEVEDAGFGQYSMQSAQWDELALLAPNYLIVKAAGNDRGRGEPTGTNHWAYDGAQFEWVATDIARPPDGGSDGYDSIIGDGATSKNVLTVGAVDVVQNGYSAPGDVALMDYSVWGPTDDGRIKPDLVSHGQKIKVAKSTSDESYGFISGTSLASGVTTGGAALVYDRLAEIESATPLSSTMKALLIHSADETGSAPGPDYSYGWGLLNVYSAIKLVSEDALAGGETHLMERSLERNRDFVLDVDVTGNKPLVVTIAWLDVPGEAQGAILDQGDLRLVNDLDLRIISPGGSTYYPWILNPAVPSNPASVGDNFRDNVEQILVSAPDSGMYQIVISHKGSLAGGSQSFSMIVTGNRNAALYSDSDGDSIYSIFEDVDQDGNIFDEDTDWNGTPNFLDFDDDGDGISTLAELGDCVCTGMPLNPPDANGNGVPDYLDILLLPVELLSFTGSATEDGAELIWQTASETNVAGFAIEQIREGQVLSEMAYVPAVGTSTTDQTYKWSVERLEPGRHVFRLTTVDLDGSRSVGPQVEIQMDLHAGLHISSAYPNPASQSCRFSVTAATDQDLKIDLVDLLGRAVKRIHRQVQADSPVSVAVDASDVPSGAYLIRVTGDSFVRSKPVTIVR